MAITFQVVNNSGNVVGIGSNEKSKSIFSKLASSISSIKNSITNLFKTKETKSEDIYNVDLEMIKNEKKDIDERLKEREELRNLSNRKRRKVLTKTIKDSQEIINQKSDVNNNSSIREDTSYFLKDEPIYNIDELLKLKSNMDTGERNSNSITFASFQKIASINNSY
ncbi:hypothetical protein [Proteus appendicitidis]|uniref:Phage protein n=1 Tax=Proteus appendicitidis TaxID=3034648 RepID=A0ABY8Y4W6_9GAMM|nr:hypothetical protein [Proteus sp. HZ0627]WIV87293.1 hypothetical protein QQS39_12510 [Proteus sp. HZ0627]